MVFLSLAPRAMADTEEVPEHYDPNGYRAVIGEPMIIIMTVFLFAVVFIAFI